MAADHDSGRRSFRDALYESLAGAELAARDAGPLLVLERLVERARGVAGRFDPAVASAFGLDDLGRIAAAPETDPALEVAPEAFGSAERFREAIYAARCLTRDPASTVDLLTTREYVAAAVVPAALADLLTDRDALAGTASFADLWRQEDGRGWLPSTAAIWKRSYGATFSREHARFNGLLATIAERLEEAGPVAAALERLNRLRRLGPPVAAAALAELHELDRRFACPIDSATLTEALESAPLCPACGFRLGDQAPKAEGRRAISAVERGLVRQQARLSRRVVARILAGPVQHEGENVDRFIRVVQASDLAGLALVLDDEVIAFLRGLLAEPAPSSDALERLTRTFPEISADNLDAALAELRRSLEAELSAGGGRLSLRPRRRP